MNLGSLKVLIGANIDPLIKDLKKSEKALKNTAQNFHAIGDNILKLTAPLVAFGGIGAKLAIDFDDSMRSVQAVMGASTEDFGKMKKAAMDAGAATKFSASQSAQALKYMGLAGWDATKSMEALPGVLDLAAASGEDLALVSDIVTDSMTAFGLAANQATAFADLLAATSSASNTNIAMLGDSFKYAAPLAGALGYTANDTALALGLMANAGVKSSQAGTALSAMLSRMVKPTKESGEAMKALGLQAANSDGTMRPLKDVLEELRAKFAKLSPEQRGMYSGMLAGQEAMKGLLAITNASTTDFDKLSGAIDNSSGKASAMSKIMEGGLGGAIRQIKSLAEAAAIQFGDRFGPALQSVADAATSALKWFNNLDESVLDNFKSITIWALAIGGALKAIGFYIQGLAALQALKVRLIVLSKAFIVEIRKLDAAISANPILFLAKVAAVAAASYFLLTREVSLMNAETRIANKITLEAQKAIAGEKLQVERLVAVIKDENASKADKKKAIEGLKNVNQEYFKDLNSEAIAVDVVTAKTDAYIDSLLKMAKVKAAEGSLIEIEQAILDVNKRLEESKPSTWQNIKNGIISVFDPNGAAGRYAGQFTDNFIKNTDDLVKQKKYLEDQLKSLSGISPVATSPTPPVGGGGSVSSSVASSGPSKEELAALKEARQLEADLQVVRKLGAEQKLGQDKAITEGLEMVNSECAAAIDISTELANVMNTVARAASNLGDTLVMTAEEQWPLLMERIENMTKNGSLLEQVFGAVTMSLVDMAESGVSSFKDLASGVIAAAAKIIRAQIMIGVSAAVAKTFQSAPWPLNLVAGPLAGAAAGMLFSALISKITAPRLAKGGLAFGSTMAIVGDNPNAHVDPEVISPLSKLKDMMGGVKQNLNIVVTGKLTGRDIYLAWEKESIARQRTAGV